MWRAIIAFIGLCVVGFGFANYFRLSFGTGDPQPYWILGSGILGVALLLQVIAWVLDIRARREGEALAAQSAGNPGPCTLCEQGGPRMPVQIIAEKRSWRRSVHHIKPLTSLPAECCPACYARLASLRGYRAMGPVLVVIIMLGAMMAFFLAANKGPWYLPLVLAALVIGIMGLWLHFRLNRVLGKVHAELRQKAGVSFWNPVLDIFRFEKRES